MCYNTDLGVKITTSMVFNADFTNPASPLHKFLVQYYYSYFVLFYFHAEHITH